MFQVTIGACNISVSELNISFDKHGNQQVHAVPVTDQRVIYSTRSSRRRVDTFGARRAVASVSVEIMQFRRGNERRDLGDLPATTHVPQSPGRLAAAVAAARGRQHTAECRGAKRAPYDAVHVGGKLTAENYAIIRDEYGIRQVQRLTRGK